MTCKWLGLEPQRKEIPHDSRTKKLIDGLSEDPEDHPDAFISIIERHNARLKKAHLLHEATRDIIQQKWIEGTALEDIRKFLQSWAPEPYWNKPMPKGMIQALLNIAPNSQVWAPIDLLNCIFRNTEPTDSIDDLVRALENLGTHQEITRVILCRLICIIISFKPFNDIIMIVCKFLIGLCCLRSYST